MEYVHAPEDIVWKEIEGSTSPGVGFALTPSVIDSDYTQSYNVQLSRIHPGGSSKPHVDDYNHAFYVISGTGVVTIARQSWPLKAGTIVKIPSGKAQITPERESSAEGEV